MSPTHTLPLRGRAWVGVEVIMRRNYHLYLSRGQKEYFSLPEKWVPLHFVESEEKTPPSIQQMALEALSNPIGTLLSKN
jgi:hypothetical protein